MWNVCGNDAAYRAMLIRADEWDVLVMMAGFYPGPRAVGEDMEDGLV